MALQSFAFSRLKLCHAELRAKNSCHALQKRTTRNNIMHAAGVDTTVKKPTLSLVKPGTNAVIQPPRKLGKHGLALWREIRREYHVDDRGGIELLAQVCAAADRAEALAACVARDGETIRTKTGLRIHPAVREELAARSFIVRTLERLGITTETTKAPGRPGIDLGWKGDDEDADEQTED